MRYLEKSYFLKLTSAISIILIISTNCAQIGDKKVAKLPSPIYTEVSYYPNGQQEYAAEYLNGKLDGVSQHWTENGILISVSKYSNGKPHGIWKRYYANQNIMYKANYFHSQKHGKEKWYYENGQVKSEESFHYGKSESTIIHWHPDGSIIY